MNKIGLFFLRFNGLMVFILLETISIYIYFSQNQTQEKTAFLSSANRLVGNLYDYRSKWTRYWNLAAVNDSLARENARLKSKLPNAMYDNTVKKGVHQQDSLFQRYQFTEASVINNSVSKRNNYLTLNKGSKHGIKPKSGVINAYKDGIVGVVVSVNEHFSTVMSLLHENSRVSAKIQRNGYFGILSWNGKDPRLAQLESIPRHVKIKKGDCIITSGFSSMFPEGNIIGYIESYRFEAGSNFYSIQVRLTIDLFNIQNVYVIDDLMKWEKEKIEQNQNNE
jgi:rod shape-determining protein MreC